MKNQTTNYPMDTHAKFGERCLKYNNGICPNTGKKYPDSKCKI